MKNLVYRNCPICDNEDHTKIFSGVDYSVSGENFDVVKCSKCDFHYTNPIPSKESIGNYYKSSSYVSHSSSKEGLINKIYHVVRWYSLKRKTALVSRLHAKGKLLDVGAGTGHFVQSALKSGWNAVGLEPDTDARKLAKDLHGVDLIPQDQLYSLENSEFDVITLWHVLEHVYDLKRDVRRLTELLTNDGVLVVAVPNRKSFDARYYKEFWAAWDLPIHLSHFVEDDIKRIFEEVGFELKETLPMYFDSFYVSMLSEKYKRGSFLNASLIGLKSNWLAYRGGYSSQIYILKRKNALERF